MSAVAGRVLLIPKGSYNSGITYNMLDVVTYEYDSYVAKTTTIGHDPTDTTYWQKMTDVGDDVNSLKETFTKNGAHNLLPMSLVGIKAFNEQGTWSGNAYAFKGVTFTVSTDSNGNVIEITANGTATANADLNLHNAYNSTDVFLPNDTYKVNNTGAIHGIELHNGYSTTTYTGVYGSIDTTVECPNGIAWTVLRVTSGTTCNNIIVKPMIRLASDPDSMFEPYAMTNRELTNVAQAEARISATNRAWPGDTLTFKNLPKSNGRWYEFTACISYDAARFLKGFITLREDNAIIVNGKQGDFTVAYNQDGDLVITLPISSHWLYDMRRSGELN